jgi:hypothetical protein
VIGQPVRSLVLFVVQSQFPVCILHDSKRQCYVSRQMLPLITILCRWVNIGDRRHNLREKSLAGDLSQQGNLGKVVLMAKRGCVTNGR